jgi:hypothetical protein
MRLEELLGAPLIAAVRAMIARSLDVLYCRVRTDQLPNIISSTNRDAPLVAIKYPGRPRAHRFARPVECIIKKSTGRVNVRPGFFKLASVLPSVSLTLRTRQHRQVRFARCARAFHYASPSVVCHGTLCVSRSTFCARHDIADAVSPPAA